MKRLVIGLALGLVFVVPARGQGLALTEAMCRGHIQAYDPDNHTYAVTHTDEDGDISYKCQFAKGKIAKQILRVCPVGSHCAIRAFFVDSPSPTQPRLIRANLVDELISVSNVDESDRCTQ